MQSSNVLASNNLWQQLSHESVWFDAWRPEVTPNNRMQRGGKAYSGNAVGQFVDARLFTFQDLTDVAPAK